MVAGVSKPGQPAQEIIRSIIELCADCETCRLLMDQDCAFFPELYRLWDQEKETGILISPKQLRHLVELCTLCGLCPCPKVTIDIMVAKSHYIEAEGMSFTKRLLSDVPRLARLCNRWPRLVDVLQANQTVGPLLRRAVGLHPERQLPVFAQENFFQWAEKKGLTRRRDGRSIVAYFVGCTAGYLFPQIGRDLVAVLERNGVTVHVPTQHCCGMPQLVEGDRPGALHNASANLRMLFDLVQSGDDLISSCPTCGFFLKKLLKERAYSSDVYQKSVHASENDLKLPDSNQGSGEPKISPKLPHRGILKDDGYFSSFDPMARISVANHLFDAGEYLAHLHADGRLDTRFSAVPGHMVYFAPCHQREQNMGRPYLELLSLVPRLSVELVDSECCGMGGSFGFKADFHEQSLTVGQPLLDRINQLDPEALITDCLSCQLQFRHCLSIPIYHPLEILALAYLGEEPS